METTTTNQTVCERPAKQITAVDLAKDVIRLIKARKIKTPPPMRSSIYLRLHESVGNLVGQSFRKAMWGKAWKPCDVCALGALFVAHVDKRNEVQLFGDTDQFNQNRSQLASRLRDYFSTLQLHLIEAAYERRLTWNETDSERREIKATPGIDVMVRSAIDFGDKIDDRRKRLIAIMQNIIANNGKFCPPLISE